jgi:hypothetical protein
MYRCELCQSVIPPHTPSQRVVVERREVTYPRRAAANREVRKGHERIKPDDPGGRGREIARERIACPPCAVNQASRSR